MSAYLSLVRAFCDMVGLVDPLAVSNGMPVDVEGVTCSMTPSHSDDPDAFVLYAEFGPVPAGLEHQVQEELLVQNCLGAPGGGAVFGFSPMTRTVVCIQRVRARGMTARRLLDLLGHLADKAREWQRGHFLHRAHAVRPAEQAPVSSANRLLCAAAR